MHLADTLFDDAFHCAAPSGMKHADGAVFGINQHHGQAVGSLNCEEESGSCGDQAVSGEEFAGNRIDTVNDVGMDLAKRDQRPERPSSVARTAPLAGDRAELAEKRNPVAFNCGFDIVFGKPKDRDCVSRKR